MSSRQSFGSRRSVFGGRYRPRRSSSLCDPGTMIYLLALGSAVLYGAADFTGGLVTRRAGTIPVVILSQASGLILLALILPVLPAASPARADLLWGGAAGLTGGIGVALLYGALAIGIMAVVAPTTAVCAVII